jgi:hypothetical protein
MQFIIWDYVIIGKDFFFKTLVNWVNKNVNFDAEDLEIYKNLPTLYKQVISN